MTKGAPYMLVRNNVQLDIMPDSCRLCPQANYPGHEVQPRNQNAAEAAAAARAAALAANAVAFDATSSYAVCFRVLKILLHGPWW